MRSFSWESFTNKSLWYKLYQLSYSHITVYLPASSANYYIKYLIKVICIVQVIYTGTATSRSTSSAHQDQKEHKNTMHVQLVFLFRGLQYGIIVNFQRTMLKLVQSALLVGKPSCSWEELESLVRNSNIFLDVTLLLLFDYCKRREDQVSIKTNISNF